jgi:hypothetical protein
LHMRENKRNVEPAFGSEGLDGSASGGSENPEVAVSCRTIYTRRLRRRPPLHLPMSA